MSELLRVENLKKYFPTRQGMLQAVDDITFSVSAGETLGIVGESGCGKSTLGRVILHLHERTDGRIIFNGEDISDVSRARLKELRKDMQIIFQDPYSSLDPRKTVASIIGEPLTIYRLTKSRNEYYEKVLKMMDVVGLPERTMYLYPHELDGGLRQRVGIARALILQPKLIVCDEPVSALDVSIQAQILNLMMRLQEDLGLTYLFITHDLSVVKHVSNDIMVMYLGQMVEKAPADEIFKHRYHPYTKALISAIPIPKYGAPDNQIILKGEISSPINIGNTCRFAPRCIYAKPDYFDQEPILEEVVPNHFVKCHYAREINNL